MPDTGGRSPDGPSAPVGGRAPEPGASCFRLASAQPGPGERLLNRDFLLFWQGQLVSLFGSQAFSLALLYALMEASGSAALLGSVAAASVIPGLLLMPLAGALADKASRRGILVTCDLVSGFSSLALAGLFLSLGRSRLLIAAIAAAAVIDKVVLSFFVPTLSATLPDLVPARRLPAANSLLQASHQGSLVTGRALAGILYAWLGAPALFALDGVTFLYAAASTALVRLPPTQGRNSGASRPEGVGAALGELAGGVRHLGTQPGLCRVLLLLGLAALVAQPLFVLLPFYAKLVLGGGAQSYGLLLAAHGVGSAAGLGAVVWRRSNGSGERTVLPLLAGGICVVSLGVTEQGWAAAAFLAGLGAAFALLNVELQSVLQLSTPPELRGRVMALVQTVAAASGALGALGGGLAVDLTQKNVSVVFYVCGAVLLAGALVPLMRPLPGSGSAKT